MAYELVQDITVSSATTSVSFTGLNFTSADDLLLVSNFVSSVDTSYYLFANGNTTNTNYYSQYMYALSTSVGSARYNSAYFGGCYPNSSTNTITKIKLTNSGYICSQSASNNRYGGSSIQNDINNVTSTFTTSAISSFTITSFSSNGIGIGSRFRLYKCVAEKVADITVSTATTSVDITGLSIDKGSEYMLVSFSSNPTTSTNSLKLYVNGNTTDSNYWNQHLYADSTSVGSSRVNSSPFMYTPLNGYQTSMAITNLKLTNNGNFVYQSDSSYRIGGSSIEIDKENGTSTFTTSLITQLTITASIANSIGVGSRFQLYKLR